MQTCMFEGDKETGTFAAYKNQGGNRYGKIPRRTKIREEKTNENSKREEKGKTGKEKRLIEFFYLKDWQKP